MVIDDIVIIKLTGVNFAVVNYVPSALLLLTMFQVLMLFTFTLSLE